MPTSEAWAYYMTLYTFDDPLVCTHHWWWP